MYDNNVNNIYSVVFVLSLQVLLILRSLDLEMGVLQVNKLYNNLKVLFDLEMGVLQVNKLYSNLKVHATIP